MVGPRRSRARTRGLASVPAAAGVCDGAAAASSSSARNPPRTPTRTGCGATASSRTGQLLEDGGVLVLAKILAGVEQDEQDDDRSRPDREPRIAQPLVAVDDG